MKTIRGDLNGPFGLSNRIEKPFTPGQSGSAMMMVLVAAVCVSLLIGLGFSLIQQSIRSTKIELTLKSQVYNIAASGLSESLSWFRSRRSQPVKVFDPKPQGDAKPGEKGLIREFPISEQGKVWGRFAILPEDVEDLSDLRGRGRKGDGLVWRIRSQGTLFVNRDPKVRYDRKPNEIIHRFKLMTEIQRVNVKPPARSAILVENANQIEILEGGRVRGLDGAALTYRQGTGEPTITVPKEVTSHGSSRFNPAADKFYDLSVKSIFGVSWRELREVADMVVEDTAVLPPIMPKMAIVLVKGDALFDPKRPLNGGGILIVDGNLDILANSNSSYSGVIYVRGHFTMDAPALISGSVISLGHTRLQGFGDFAEIQFSESAIGFIKQRLGQYRQTQPLLRVRS